jgi:hypothetical protein
MIQAAGRKEQHQGAAVDAESHQVLRLSGQAKQEHGPGARQQQPAQMGNAVDRLSDTHARNLPWNQII